MHGADASLQADDALIDLVALGGFVWQRKWWVAAAAALGLAAALLFLNFATPKFAASLRVTPASSTGSGVAGALGRIGNLAAIAGVAARPGNESAQPFDLYLDRLRSRELAAELAKEERILKTVFATEWDPSAGRFVERPGLLRPLRNLFYGLAGQPLQPWNPPGASQLQEYLAKEVAILPPAPRDPPITVLSLRHRDAEFARHLLSRMHDIADADVRRQSLARANEYADHLALKLATTDIAEHRRTLSEALLEQQRAIMMATASGAFAAIPTEAATASRRPVAPQLATVLALGLILGAVAGLVALTAAYLLRPRARALQAERDRP
jgi:hypothetical protein